MEEVTFWRAWDPKWGTTIIQGYEVKYGQTIGGQRPYYKHFTSQGSKRSFFIGTTFKFEKGEHIICVWARTGAVVDNIEFQTNKMRYFNAGCTGGFIRQLQAPC